MDADDYKATLAAWRKSPVFGRSLLEEADLLPTSKMLLVEDLSDTALPQTTDTTTHINPPEKCQQIGVSAAKCLLRGFLNAEASAERTATLVIDLTVHTLDMSRAFVSEKNHKALPATTHYMGFVTSEDHKDWAEKTLVNYLTEGYLQVDGADIPLPPDQVLPPAEMPADLVQTAPALPSLNLLVPNEKLRADGVASLSTPEKILKCWHDHGRFGAEFREWLQQARADPETLLDIKAERADAATKEKGGQGGGQRRVGGSGGGSNKAVIPPVKQELSEFDMEKTLIPVEELPTPLKYEGNLPGGGRGKQGPVVLITIGEKIFLVNRTEQMQVIQSGSMLAGFFKGCWWYHNTNGDEPDKKRRKKEQQETNQEPSDADILFTLQGSNSLVQVGGQILTLGAFGAEKQRATPNWQVAYHTCQDAPLPTDPAHFTCKTVHHMYFRVGELSVDETKSSVPLHHMAGLVPWHTWDSPISHLVWNMKWSPNRGLVPVRPVVLAKCEVKLPPGHAMPLNKNQEVA